MTGFTYNGVHCEDLGLYYIPTREDQWFPDAEFEVYDTNIDWRHGGVYFDSKAGIRTFTLKCYFEEITIAQRQAIKEWVRRDSYGVLIFDDMPFVYWNVRPSDIPAGNWYIDNHEKHSGTVTLTFRAYEPFGYLTRKSNVGDENDNAEDYCNLIDTSDMPDEPTTSDTSFDIYNPGTEVCGLSIDLAGSTSNDFRLFNEANNTICEFNSLPTNSLRLRVDGDTGFISVYMAGSTTFENGFAYHNKGILRLEPNAGRSGVEYVNGTVSGTEYQLDLVGYKVTNAIRGATVTLDGGGELVVESVSIPSNRIWCTATGSVTLPEEGTCSIKTVNHIVIEEKINSVWTTPSTLNLSYIKTDYHPRAL